MFGLTDNSAKGHGYIIEKMRTYHTMVYLFLISKIPYLGLVWVNAHHPWSSQDIVFNSHCLLHHLIGKVLPMTNCCELPPPEPTINFTSSPEMLTLGTESELEFVHNFENKNNVEELKENVTAK